MKTLKIATRKSKLAMWQTHWVQKILFQHHIKSEAIPIETKGDLMQKSSLQSIGSKGVFTEALEEYLKKGQVDLAVHSAKDLPAHLEEGFEIIAFGPRESPIDVLVSDKKTNLKAPLVVGTAGTRRIAQIAKYYSHFKTLAVRGNLQTRMKKMQSGICDALVLARAGIQRMNWQPYIVFEFPLDTLTPPAGQGSIAIESYKNVEISIKKEVRKWVNCPKTEREITAERSYLKKMNGGCSIPIFAHATCSQSQIVEMTAGILSLDGSTELKATYSDKNPETLGIQLANKIIQMGGKEMINEINKKK